MTRSDAAVTQQAHGEPPPDAVSPPLATPRQPTRSPATHVLKLVGAGLLIVILVTCLFCPRFVLWNGLDVPEAWPYPEVNRAVPALEQTRRPFMEVPRVVGIIRWRLLMPVIAYVTRMPDSLYLALPHVGCVIVVAFVLHVTIRATQSWSRALAAGAIVAASPWLFTSMGWLAYFDSWLVLAVLVASFARSRWALAMMFLLAPWVDERVIVAAPLCLLVRTAWLHRDSARPLRETLVDAGVVALLVVPYVIGRLVVMRGSDENSAYYLTSTIEVMRAVPLSRFLEGLWFAHRAAWLLIFAAVAMIWTTRGWQLGVAALLIVLATTALTLGIAGDLSRSPAVLLPTCLTGMLLLWERRVRQADVAVAAVLVLNLLLPARHVVTSFVIPIRGLPHELRSWLYPPQELDPWAHLQLAAAAMRQGRPGEAVHFVDNALKLDASVITHDNVRLRADGPATAARIIDAVLAADPDAPDALLARARLHVRSGNDAAAAGDLRRALEVADAKWPKRRQAERLLRRLGAGR